MTKGTLKTVTVTVLSGITGMILGGWLVMWITAAKSGEQAMVALQNDLSALGYLEKHDLPRAHHMLRLAVENNLILVDRHGAAALNRYDEHAVSRWVKQYREIRDAHPLIDYKDGGTLAALIDQIVRKHVDVD